MPKLISCIILSLGLIGFASATPNPALSITSDNSDDKTLQSILASQPFVKTGEATFSILFWDLYQSQLQTTSGRYPIAIESEQLIFQIRYLADISNDDLIMRTIEQWQHQGISDNTYQHYVEKLATMWPNIKKGDQLAMLMQKGKSVFYFNDQYLGAIDDDVFGPLFVNIWLAESTSEPSLRAQLLGENIND